MLNNPKFSDSHAVHLFGDFLACDISGQAENEKGLYFKKVDAEGAILIRRHRSEGILQFCAGEGTHAKIARREVLCVGSERSLLQ